ncbi:MFS transporter [Rudaeicoccus suwonensis]|uniref:MFS transporter n=1 Tax=Rudaeicoccus suwonensis TaxID=657409 RepID=A0A561E9Y6_9MICO|nr:MFS transporter [Rudaeicoccus suwonensis]TWE12434.1 MFS transporter [Rudaeicoccus suwonensis]
MLTPYRSLLQIPGARTFLAGSFFARLGGAMFGVAVVAMISGRRGSYGLAGAVSAVGLVVLAVTAAPIGRFIDGRGQRRVTLPLIIWSTAWGGAMILVSLLDAPSWLLFVTYAMSAVVAATGSMSRARWSYLLDGQPDRLHTAMSLEQVADELSFVLGPAIAVLLATTVLPEAGLIAAFVLYAAGSWLFVSARSTEPPVHVDASGGTLVLRNPAVVVVAIVMVLTGGIFGSNEVVTLAFSQAHGYKDMSGLILALFAIGSATAAVVFGTRGVPGSLARMLLLGTAAMFVLEAPVLLVDSLPWLAGVLLLAGFATAPTLITSMKLAQRLVPQSQVNESMGVVFTGTIIGIAAGSAISGAVVQHWGARAGFVVPVASGFGALVLAALSFQLLRRTTGDPASEPALQP